MFLLPFHVISASHHHNDATRLGRVRLTGEALAEAQCALRAMALPSVLLSSCHRTELYWWGSAEPQRWFRGLIAARSGEDGAPLVCTEASADLAVRHLFRVASGMESVRFGEPEILGQLRQAWLDAPVSVEASHGLQDLFRHAIDAARHIREAMGPSALPSLGGDVRRLIAELAAEEPSRPLRVLVVGAGAVARDVLASLVAPNATSAWRTPPLLAVTNRTADRGEALVRWLAGEGHKRPALLPWDARPWLDDTADVVIFAVHGSAPLVRAGDVADLHHGRTLPLWMDLGVPRAVDGTVPADRVRLVSLDDLVPPAAAREGQRAQAEAALQRELARVAKATERKAIGARVAVLSETVRTAASRWATHEPVPQVADRVLHLVLRELARVDA